MPPTKASRSIANLEDLTKVHQNYVATIVTNGLDKRVPTRLGVDYEDVMQEIWLKMMHMLTQYDESRASVKTFLTLTCFIVIRSHNSKLRKLETHNVPCGDFNSTVGKADDGAASVDCEDLLETITSRLSPLAREVLDMRMNGASARVTSAKLNKGIWRVLQAVSELKKVATPVLQESGLI